MAKGLSNPPLCQSTDVNLRSAVMCFKVTPCEKPCSMRFIFRCGRMCHYSPLNGSTWAVKSEKLQNRNGKTRRKLPASSFLLAVPISAHFQRYSDAPMIRLFVCLKQNRPC